MIARPMPFKCVLQMVHLADSFTVFIAGIIIASSKAIIAITTSNSIRVKAFFAILNP